jgi:hypothetical protein
MDFKVGQLVSVLQHISNHLPKGSLATVVMVREDEIDVHWEGYAFGWNGNGWPAHWFILHESPMTEPLFSLEEITEYGT